MDRKVTFLIGANIKNFQKGLNSAQKSMRSFGRDMERARKNLTQKLTVPIGLVGLAAGKAAIDFESAFAGVRKTVDATESQFAGLRKGILDMSKTLPTSANEIAGVAEAAGQLGISTDNILEFSRNMVMLGDTTNMTANEAATSLARLANIMQLPQDEFDRMGSTIVDLGNNFATTEAEITDMSTRLAAAGNIANMSASDIFGISAALSSVGVRAESGGTAAQKGILLINDAVATGNKSLQVFAETAGMSAEQFQTAWRDDSGQAFAAFINGLGKQGDMATTTLGKVGLSNERARTAFLSLANAGDLVNQAMQTGSTAWEENTALAEEANERYKTIGSRLLMLKNRIVTIGVTIGDALMPAIEKAIEFTEKMTIAFEQMSDKSIKQLILLAGALAATGPLMVAVTVAAKVIAGFAALVMTKFTLIAGGIGLVVVAGQNMVDNWEIFAASMRGVWMNMQRGALQMAKAVLSVQQWTDFSGAATANLALVEQSLEDLNEEYANNGRYIGLLRDDAVTMGESAGNALEKLKNIAQDLFGGVISGTALDDLLSAFDEAGEKAENTAKSVDKLSDSIKRINVTGIKVEGGNSGDFQAPGMTKAITNGFEEITRKAAASAEASLSSWTKFVQNAKEAGFDFTSFLSGQMASAITSFAESVGMAFSGAGNQWANGLEKMLLIVTDFATNLGSLLASIGAAMMFIPGLQGLAAKYMIGGAALIGVATGVSAGIEKRISNREQRANEQVSGIPGMATGGIIPSGFPNDTYPAFLSSGETVIPSPKALPQMGGGKQMITNILNLDGREIYRNQREIEQGMSR